VELLLLPKNRTNEFVAEIMRAYRLIAPLRRNEELLFAEVGAPEQVVLDYRNTVKAPKAVLFPQTECMIRFQRHLDQFNEVQAVPLNTAPTVVLGIRPCDARSYLFMDRIFGLAPSTAPGQYFDPYYRARRESTLIFSLACDRPRQTCFCHAFGSGPYDRQGSDVFMRDAGDAYLVEAASERGAQALQAMTSAPESPFAVSPSGESLAQAAAIEAQAMGRLNAVEPVPGIEAMLPALFESPLWAEVSEKCLACGTCTYNCPNCHCFFIEDRLLAEGGERVRGWDSCMYPMFTQHASGHNPRPNQAARWRQRAMHKFEYLPRNVELYGCVGCGRCVQSCPVRLDIRHVLRRVRQAYMEQQAKVGETK
jgi:sulfhydrogenase subunit beta (sulfur reductase)